MKQTEKKLRVPITIVADNNVEFDKKIVEACEKFTVLEKHINISPVMIGSQNGQAQMVPIHCCYIISLMTEDEKKSFEVRQTLTLQK